MPQPVLIQGLNQIAARYDAVLSDVWGVIHNGRASFPAASRALTRFQETRGPVVLISNAPRPSSDVIPQLHALGVAQGAWSGFVTSGDATRSALAARAPGPAWAIGPERDETLYDGLGLSFAGPGDADFISCTGLIDDEVETPEDYRASLAIAAERGLQMICANPDRIVHRGARLIYCAGALADLYVELGGTVIMAGKPYAPIYALALAEADRLAGRTLDRARILAIGDGSPTDLLGAQAAGLDCLFITGGIHGSELHGADGRPTPERLHAFLAANRAHAAYAMAELDWGG